MLRGALIVVEGLDRSGKSTQCARLVKELQQQGKRVELLRFPERSTPIGSIINTYLQRTSEMNDHAIHLLFSANRWEMDAKIHEKIEAGITLIVDRYVFSGAAFSAAKGLPLEWCKSCDLGLPRPDSILFLDVTQEKAAERGGFGGERYEVREIQEKTSYYFAQLRLSSPEDWQVVDASLSLDQVYQQMLSHIQPTLGKVEQDPNPIRLLN